MAVQSQGTEKAGNPAKQAEVIGIAIHNPPQEFAHTVKVGGRTHTIVNNDGTPLGGKDNPCHIETMINGTIYTLPTGATYIFPNDAAAHLLKTYPWLEEINDKELIKVAPQAPTREPTEREAPILWAAKKAAAKGQKFYALTESGDRVLISTTREQTVTPAPLDRGIEMTEH